MINKILITVFMTFVASSSFAADLSALDVDKDGLISKDEASASQTLIEQWDVLDVNKDGYLQKDELAALGDTQGN